MSCYPAGYSDDEEDSDLDDFDLYEKRQRPRPPVVPQQPQNIIEAITSQNADSLLHFINISITNYVNLNQDHVTREKPLIIACSVLWPKGVEILLEHGANPNIERELLTPLLLCCTEGIAREDEKVECMELLLNHGADPNMLDCRGRVPLHVAADAGLVKVVNCLLKCPRTDKHAKDPAGWTALFFARKKGHEVVFKTLIDAGLDPEVKAYNSRGINDFDQIIVEKEEDLTVRQLFCESRNYSSDNYQIECQENTALNRVENFLKCLPNNAGDGGFSDCAARLLDSAGCSDLCLEGVQLPDVLCGDVGVLQRLGAKFSWSQRRIIKTAHQLHLSHWKKASLVRVPKDEPLGLEKVGDLLSTQLQQLVMMNASLKYVRHRVTAAAGTPEAVADLTATLTDLIQLQKAQTRLKRALHNVFKKMSQFEDINANPIDYLGPVTCGKGTAPKWPLTVIPATVSLLLVAVSYYYIV